MRQTLPAALIAASLVAGAAAAARPPRIETFIGGPKSYLVTSTLISGPKGLTLIDAQLTMTDGRALARRVAATGRPLDAIFITHPDADHYIGLAALHERFPAAPIYMTSEALSEYHGAAAPQLERRRRTMPDETPDQLPQIAQLPPGGLTGSKITFEIIQGQGDYGPQPVNSAIWIPAAATLISGDTTFDGVYPWLGKSTPLSRRRWLAFLDRLEALRPVHLISGHKNQAGEENVGQVFSFMRRYIADFDALCARVESADALTSGMLAKYPNLKEPDLLRSSASSVECAHFKPKAK